MTAEPQESGRAGRRCPPLLRTKGGLGARSGVRDGADGGDDVEIVRVWPVADVGGLGTNARNRGVLARRRASPGRLVAPKVRRFISARLWRDGTAIWLQPARLPNVFRIWRDKALLNSRWIAAPRPADARLTSTSASAQLRPRHHGAPDFRLPSTTVSGHLRPDSDFRERPCPLPSPPGTSTRCGCARALSPGFCARRGRIFCAFRSARARWRKSPPRYSPTSAIPT